MQNILDYFENNRKIFNNVQGDVSFIDKFAKFQISDKSQCMCTKGTQTIYRDSEIQTNPLITYALDMNYLDNNILHLTTRKQGTYKLFKIYCYLIIKLSFILFNLSFLIAGLVYYIFKIKIERKFKKK